MNYNNSPEKQLLLMQPALLQGVATPVGELPTHKWGIFGEYEFLGPGTPYALKMEAGTKPRNSVDKIAMYHDEQYLNSKRNNQARALYDLGAGSAMINTLHPLGILAGTGLISQGLIRLTPFGEILDLIFY